MRNPNRILIASKLLFNKDILPKFLNNDDSILLKTIYRHQNYIITEWLKSPDLRFGQLLSILHLIDNITEDHIWNIEETLWLVDNNYCSFEDIHFWGINYFKNNKKRKSVKYKLLRDLDLDHIKNIIKFFEKYNALNQLNKEYLEYFNKRIELNE